MAGDISCTCGPGTSIHKRTCPMVVAYYAKEEALKPFKNSRCLGTCRVQTIGATTETVTLHGEGCTVLKEDNARQASAEPTFSYANGALDDAETIKRRAHESAVRQALASEAKAHQWEHKQPNSRTGRTFTREEVLTVIAAYTATWDLSGDSERVRAADQVLAELGGIFKRIV